VPLDWNDLPLDMQEHVLGCLSFFDLARTSRTSRAFRAWYRREMIKLPARQTARLAPAVTWLGRARIMSIAGTIEPFLIGQFTFKPGTTHACRISEDGKCHSLGRAYKKTIDNQLTHEVGVIRGTTASMKGGRTTSIMLIRVYAPNESWVDICVTRIPIGRRVDVKSSVVITVVDAGVDDVEGVALVQGLLTWGFGPKYDAAWSRDNVSLRRCFARKNGLGFTDAALQDHMAPLLPLVARHSICRIGGWGFELPL
jgi:hypothetical protein